MGIRLGMVEGDKDQHTADVLILWLALLEPQAGDRSTIRFAFPSAQNGFIKYQRHQAPKHEEDHHTGSQNGDICSGFRIPPALEVSVIRVSRPSLWTCRAIIVERERLHSAFLVCYG